MKLEYSGQWPTEQDDPGSVVMQLTVPLDRVPEDAAAAARDWFQSGFGLLDEDVRNLVLNSPEPDLEWTSLRPDATKAGVFLKTLKPTGLVDYEATYSAEAWSRFLAALGELPPSAIFEIKKNDARGWPTRFCMAVASQRFDDPWMILSIKAGSAAGLFRSESGQRTALRYIRWVADQCNPTYGGIFFTQSYVRTPLEEALSLWPEDTVPASRQTLRGYGWVTIMAEEIGSRLGGVDGIRASGAFAEVAHLQRGGFWLKATDRLEQYRQAEAERIYRVLAPVLPVPSRQ